jgi:UDP-N-acetyl-D-glucosamine dehydrogenase
MDGPGGGDRAGDVAARLLRRIEARTARVGIIGLGYVGLPLAATITDQGFPVLGFDIDPAKVEALNAGRSYIRHIGAERVGQMRASGRFEATADFDRIPEADLVLICVPTLRIPRDGGQGFHGIVGRDSTG